MEEKNTPTRGQVIKREIFSWARVLLFAAAAAFIINNVIIVNAAVPTASMADTIGAHTRLVALRLAYLFAEPERLDVVVFRFPDDESELHVKRIIGLPGDTVEIRDGLVFINDDETPLYEWYLLEPPRPAHGIWHVPPDSYFVMGDNRNRSQDSRSWQSTPFLPRENILGRAAFIYFPHISAIR